MKNVLFFDSMLTPKIITVVYWLMLLGAVVYGGITMFFGYNTNFILGLAQVLGGFVGARLWCELMIVIFKINANLQKLADKKEPTA